MKKYILILLILSASLQAAAQFQPKHDIVKFHVLHLFGSTFKAGYEHFGTNFNRSVVLQLSYTGTNTNMARSGVEGEFQYRIYAVQTFSAAQEEESNYYHGFYFAPFVGYRYLQRFESQWWGPMPDEYTAYYNSYRFGTNLGYQFTILNNIYFDGSLGGGVKIGSEHAPSKPPASSIMWDPANDGIFWPGYTGVYPRFDFAIGFAF